MFVMSYKLWASRFGLDPSIVGRTFTLNGVPTTLVGVMPERVSKLAADVWMPLHLDPADPPAARSLLPLPGAAEARRHAGAGVGRARRDRASVRPDTAPRLPGAVRRLRRIVHRQHRRPVPQDALHDGRRRRAAAADRVHQRRQHAAQPRRRPRAGDGGARRRSGPAARAWCGSCWSRACCWRSPARRSAACSRSSGITAIVALIPEGLIPREAQDPAEHAGAALQPRRRGDHGPDLRAGAGAADRAASVDPRPARRRQGHRRRLPPRAA